MKDMNMSVEVESGLKQLESSVEVEDNTIGKSDKTSDSLKSLKSKRLIWRFVYNTCGKSKRLICSFVYNVCGYPITPIPSQLQPELEFAHPSPLVRLFQSKKSTSTTDNLLMGSSKLTRWIKWAFTHCLVGLSNVALCLRNDMSMNSGNNEHNLQSINTDNQSYDNRLSDYTYNNMILMNMTKIY